MEGEQLVFLVTYKDHQAIMTLSEYDTVEHLKMEIDNNFNIPVVDQVISGWHSIPESGDDIILQLTSKPANYANCLVVTNSKEKAQEKTNNDCLVVTNSKEKVEEKTNNDEINDQSFSIINSKEKGQEKTNNEMEIEATKSLKEKLPGIPLNLQSISLQDVISNIVSGIEKRILLLYLHNSEDVFSHCFLGYVYDEELSGILEKSFLIVGWDVEDPSYHIALLSALEPFESLSFISQLVTNKMGAAICLMMDNNNPVIFSYLRGDVSYLNVIEVLRNVQENLDPSLTNDNSHMDVQDEDLKELEIEAIESLRRKVPANTSITFRYCTLDDALNFICTAPFDEKKALLLYLHNSEQPFSKIFSNNLESGEMVQILNRSFLVLGWDVEDPKYHDALANALGRHVNLSDVTNLVKSKVSVGLCILPVTGTISVSMCLRGNLSIKEIVKSLSNFEKEFINEINKEKELKALENRTSSENDLGSEKLHSIWADMLGDRDYDSFEFNEHSYLKEKIGFAIKGPPQKLTGYEKKTIKQIDALYKVIETECNEIAEFKGKIEISFIYNCLEPLPNEKMKRAKKYDDYNPQTDVNPVPIFVLRKCRGSNNPCRVFIDDTGRVYQSWKGYLTKNKFPECEMIVPLNGRYEVTNDIVQLEKHLSPACHLDTKLLQVGDVVGTAAGLASGAVFIAAAIPALPVVAPLLIAAGVVGATAGAWAIGRSIHTLVDRATHKETMSFANSEARGAYLNIVAGSLGFVGAGANMALTQMVKSGANIGQGATYLVNTVGILNIGAGGASLLNSGYDVLDQWFNENQTPSALTILQLSTSVLFFGHAVYNFRGARTIIDETQARVLKDYNDSLRSNRHRKTFDKLVKETLRTHGDGARGKAEVISAIRNIQNKDEVFAALTRNNKALNRAGVKFSAEGGQIKLDGISVDMNEFIGLNKKQTATYLNNLPQQTSQQPVPTNSTTTGYSNSFTTAVRDILADIHIDTSGPDLNQIIQWTSNILLFCSGDIKTKVINAVHEAIRYVMDKLAKPIAEGFDEIIPKSAQYCEFIRLAISYFSSKVDEWEEKYQMYERTKHQNYYDPLFEQINPLYAKRIVTFFELVVRNSYSGETLIRAVLTEISGYVTAWISRVIFENEEKKACEERRRIHSAGFRVKIINCHDCGGYYFQHVK